jgi:hypothetical protein
MSSSMTRIKQCPPGWFALLWQCELYDEQQRVWKGILKTQIVCWTYDIAGQKEPIPFGFTEEEVWNELNHKISGVIKEGDTLAPLALDATLTPDGQVLTPLGQVFSSMQDWLEADGRAESGTDVPFLVGPGKKQHVPAFLWPGRV